VKFTDLVCGKNDSDSDLDNYEVYLPWLLRNQTYKQKQLSFSIDPQVANTSTLTVTIDLYVRYEPIEKLNLPLCWVAKMTVTVT
jgi:hypothetical protein